MTPPSRSVLTGPAASLLRRRWFWIAFVAVLAVLGATAGGSALASRGGLATIAQETATEPDGAFTVDGAVTSSRSTSAQANGNANGNGNGQGNANAGSNGNGNGSGQGNANANAGSNGNGNGNGNGNANGQGDPASALPPVVTPPVVTLPGEIPVIADGGGDDAPATPEPTGPAVVEPVLTLPEELTPPAAETPAVPEPGDVPAAPAVPAVPEVVVAPVPAAVPVVAVGVAPGCVDGKAVLAQEAQNKDTKGVSVNFLANADFATSGSLALTTAPDSKGRDQVTATAASGKAYVGAGSVSVRTYRAGQTLGGVTYPAVSETRKLAYDAFTCERPAVLTNVKTQLVNGRINLAQYARNTGNTTLQVKFNATAHFAASASFSLAPGEAKYVLVPTQSLSVPSAAVSVNVVTTVQGTRIALNQNNRHDALSVAVPN